ncbi:MAG: hypothetical protein J6C62_06755 [Clostridia bacterium]|nr:hypothetical protein [Clostridia bacterium]
MSDEQKELFNKWEELYADRLEERVESKFARGLKIGFQLAIQIADLDI